MPRREPAFWTLRLQGYFWILRQVLLCCVVPNATSKLRSVSSEGGRSFESEDAMSPRLRLRRAAADGCTDAGFGRGATGAVCAT